METDTHLSRREFVAGGVGLAAASSGMAGIAETHGARRHVLKGFVVADAHFGWANKVQPTPDKQREMMRRILRRFPDLDLFVDTGDIRHGNLHGAEADRAEADWTDIIADGCGNVPFFYVPGNHEVMGTRDGDPEWRCCQLGNMPARPYYSFDLMGVHFVSLPELTRTVYLTRESLEWLALDLAVHKERTTIVFSHNNLLGTTRSDEEGYRGLVNTKEVLALLDRFPNVVAWMHGHNHHYEVVRKHGRLYVSNGRIGGFDPSRRRPEGSHGLGGIYFEVAPDRLSVRSYSAEREKFLDEVGVKAVSGVLERKTSLDPSSPPAFSYGFGGARDGQRIPVYHHYAGDGATREVFLGGVEGEVFNDDPTFELFMSRTKHKPKVPHRQLMGSGVRGPNSLWRWNDPGLVIRPREDPNRVTMLTVPRRNYGQYCYYRCAPGRRYRATVTLSSESGGQEAKLTLLVHDRQGKCLATLPGSRFTVGKGETKRSVDFDVPELGEHKTIYTDAKSDNVVHVMVQAELSKLTAPVTIRQITLSLSDAQGPRRNPSIAVGGMVLKHDGELRPGQVARKKMPVPMQHREVHTVRVEGNRRVSWLVRCEGLRWQVRNAPAVMRQGKLEIGSIRNDASPDEKVVVAPLSNEE